MSKDKITAYAEIKPRGDWQTEGQIKANYEIVRDEDGNPMEDANGRILVRRKGGATNLTQRRIK